MQVFAINSSPRPEGHSKTALMLNHLVKAFLTRSHAYWSYKDFGEGEAAGTHDTTSRNQCWQSVGKVGTRAGAGVCERPRKWLA